VCRALDVVDLRQHRAGLHLARADVRRARGLRRVHRADGQADGGAPDRLAAGRVNRPRGR
jgi:hypothetical protein